MATFRYEAVNASGDVEHGLLEAVSSAAAAEQLTRSARFPLSIEASGGQSRIPAWLRSPISLSLSLQRSLGPRDVLVMTEQLAALTGSGLTLDRALTIALRVARGERQRNLLERLHQQIRRGASFAEAVTQEGTTFPTYYQTMIRAGESGGTLAPTLARLATLMGRTQDIRDRLTAALIYPAILMAMIGLTLVMVLVFVLPRFEALFAEAGAQLPLPTRIVLWLGVACREYGLFVALGIAVLLLGAAELLRRPGGRLRLDGWLLRRRLLDDLIGARESARFARTLSALLSGGLPLVAALRIAIDTLGNRVLRQAADQALVRIKEGQSFGAELLAARCFPPLLVQMISVGEETGRLPESLSNAADMLDADAQRAIDRALTALVPLVTVLMGALVAALIGSVLIGILSINDLAG